MATTTKTRVDELEAIVLELLGNLLKEDPKQLRQRLQKMGEGMPVDSLDLFDVLAEFRKRTGLGIPVKNLRRNTLRSVRAFCDFAAAEGS